MKIEFYSTIKYIFLTTITYHDYQFMSFNHLTIRLVETVSVCIGVNVATKDWKILEEPPNQRYHDYTIQLWGESTERRSLPARNRLNTSLERDKRWWSNWSRKTDPARIIFVVRHHHHLQSGSIRKAPDEKERRSLKCSKILPASWLEVIASVNVIKIRIQLRKTRNQPSEITKLRFNDGVGRVLQNYVESRGVYMAGGFRSTRN